jgi:hypothetical protein
MYFYIDESGHTGPNLFDEAQPILYYGVLSSKVNVDALAETRLAAMRKRLGVARLHAAELGNGGLVNIVEGVCSIQKQLSIRFDLYRIAKADHAIICFFDQVFDQGVNPAMTWTGYWTPLRYILLLKVASLFNDELARQAWEARICVDDSRAQAGMQTVCRALRGRLDRLPDARSRQLLADALEWAETHPAEISYNVSNKKMVLDVTPNMVGFQSVMHGIASRIKKDGRQASKIIVDRQSQFNKSQRTLADFYSNSCGIPFVSGPGMPVMDLKHMPRVPIEFSSSTDSAGLELVDIHLWIFKRMIENRDVAPELYSIVKPQLHRGRTDEISLNALASRWTKHLDQIPQLEDMPPEQVARGKEILRIDEERRLRAVRGGE